MEDPRSCLGLLASKQQHEEGRQTVRAHFVGHRNVIIMRGNWTARGAERQNEEFNYDSIYIYKGWMDGGEKERKMVDGAFSESCCGVLIIESVDWSFIWKGMGNERSSV